MAHYVRIDFSPKSDVAHIKRVMEYAETSGLELEDNTTTEADNTFVSFVYNSDDSLENFYVGVQEKFDSVEVKEYDFSEDEEEEYLVIQA